jgi:tetratricopeptide (TPR) repeat protein
MHWLKYDPTPARKALQRDEAETALRLAPGLPQAHLAMGLVHYQVSHDYRRALAEYRIALRGQPNDVSILSSMGFVQRRLGDWTGVDSVFTKVSRLDPANAKLLYDLGGITFLAEHRFADAVHCLDRALAVAPDLWEARLFKATAYVLWKGDLDSLRATLDAMPPGATLGGSGSADLNRVLFRFYERRPDSVLALVGRSREAVFESQDYLIPASLFVAQASRLRGDERAARSAFARALVTLDSVAAVEQVQDQQRVHSARGLILAGLGRRAEALQEARWLAHDAEARNDAFYGAFVLEQSALIRAQAGDADGAIDQLERVLARPSWISVHTLRLDPRWDPIRDRPRFKALLVKYANPEAARPR